MFIATFFNHYGAIKFRSYAKAHGFSCTLMPVPRVLSSSCGTCAGFEAEGWDTGFRDESLEGIYRRGEDGTFFPEYRAKE